MGERYYRWAKTDRSREQAYLELAANLGHRQGMMELGRYYMVHYPRDTAKLHRAVELMEEARAAGAKADMRMLAELYEKLGDTGRAAQSYLEPSVRASSAATPTRHTGTRRPRPRG